MNEKLAPLSLITPPLQTHWTGTGSQTTQSVISGRGDASVLIGLPLCWYAPDWYRIDADLADAMAVSVGRRGVVVAALRSELSGVDESWFHRPDADRFSGQSLVRMAPYRPERYGWVADDFDGTSIIDVRLTLARDTSGRYAFSPEQVARWESTPDESPLAGGSWVPAAVFPPDVVSCEQLVTKLEQLRRLAPEAVVFVSLDPVRLDDELPSLLASQPDGVIMRLDQHQLDGLQLAVFTRRARQQMNAHGGGDLPLWIVPGPISPDDAVKLIALGASGIAIDAWCNPIRDRAPNVHPTSSLDYKLPPEKSAVKVDELVDQELAPLLARFAGLYLALDRAVPGDLLGSFDPAWSTALDVRSLG